eukprot:48360_1
MISLFYMTSLTTRWTRHKPNAMIGLEGSYTLINKSLTQWYYYPIVLVAIVRRHSSYTSPCSYNVEESISTLLFGERAKKIKTKARINQIKTSQQYRKELHSAQTESLR